MGYSDIASKINSSSSVIGDISLKIKDLNFNEVLMGDVNDNISSLTVNLINEIDFVKSELSLFSNTLLYLDKYVSLCEKITDLRSKDVDLNSVEGQSINQQIELLEIEKTDLKKNVENFINNFESAEIINSLSNTNERLDEIDLIGNDKVVVVDDKDDLISVEGQSIEQPNELLEIEKNDDIFVSNLESIDVVTISSNSNENLNETELPVFETIIEDDNKTDLSVSFSNNDIWPEVPVINEVKNEDIVNEDVSTVKFDTFEFIVNNDNEIF